MTDYSEDGKWWWDGESWIPTTQQQQSNVPESNKPVTTNISEEASSPRIIISESSKKKLAFTLVTQNGTKQIEFIGTFWGGGYNMIIDNQKPVLVTSKFGMFSKNTTYDRFPFSWKTKTKHYFGKDLKSCELIFCYKSGMNSNSIKNIEISSKEGFYFSHEI